MESTTLQTESQQPMENISNGTVSVPIDWVVIFIIAFTLGAWIAHIMTKAGISSIRLVDTGDKKF